MCAAEGSLQKGLTYPYSTQQQRPGPPPVDGHINPEWCDQVQKIVPSSLTYNVDQSDQWSLLAKKCCLTHCAWNNVFASPKDNHHPDAISIFNT